MLRVSKIKFHGPHPEDSNFANDVLEGLLKQSASIPPKYFYDAKGSKLFDAITELTGSDGGSCARVRIGESEFRFTTDESTHKENSCKYTTEEFKKLAPRAWSHSVDLWVDG